MKHSYVYIYLFIYYYIIPLRCKDIGDTLTCCKTCGACPTEPAEIDLSSLLITVEILAYDQQKADKTCFSAFEVIQKYDDMPIRTNKYKLEIDDNVMANYFVDQWGVEEGNEVVMILVRVNPYAMNGTIR